MHLHSAVVQPHGVRVQAFEERHLCSLRLYCRPVDGATVSFGEQMGSASTPTRLLPRLWRLPGRGRTVASKCEGRCRRGRARAGEPQHLHRRVSWRARAVGREQGEPSLTHRRASGRASRRYRHFPSWGRRCGASVAEGAAAGARKLRRDSCEHSPLGQQANGDGGRCHGATVPLSIDQEQ